MNNDNKPAVPHRKQRHSLQQLSTLQITDSPLRHTKSHNYGPKVKRIRKSTIPAAIAEVETSDDESLEVVNSYINPVSIVVGVENERRAHRKPERDSQRSTKSNRSTHTYDNAAFEGGLPPRHATDSIRTSSRPPSVQSLSVVREQYCCCAKRTKCERILIGVLAVLIFIIIVLFVVIGILAENYKNDCTTDESFKLF